MKEIYDKWYTSNTGRRNYRYDKLKDEYGGRSKWKYSPKPKFIKCGQVGHYDNKCLDPPRSKELVNGSFLRLEKNPSLKFLLKFVDVNFVKIKGI